MSLYILALTFAAVKESINSTWLSKVKAKAIIEAEIRETPQSKRPCLIGVVLKKKGSVFKPEINIGYAVFQSRNNTVMPK